VQEYVRETISAFDTATFIAVFDAIYGFRLTDLAAVDAPTLLVNGEFESRSLFEHAAYVERTVPDARSVVIPAPATSRPWRARRRSPRSFGRSSSRSRRRTDGTNRHPSEEPAMTTGGEPRG
jgi:hypothetical protein